MSEKSIKHDVSFIKHSLNDARIWWHHVQKLTDESLAQAERMEPLNLLDMDDTFKREVNLAILNRRQQIQKLGLVQDERLDSNSGKLLIYLPDWTMFDGLSQDATQGLVDYSDCPASQFWLGYYPYTNTWNSDPGPHDALFSWIPNELIEVISRGFAVNATECFDWIDSEIWKDNAIAEDLGRLTRRII